MSNLQALYDFIDRATKDRKYPPTTASNLRSPLRLMEPELSEEEKNSVDVLESRLDQILNTIYNKGKSNLSASSLQEYKRRVRKLVEDYHNFGVDPSKMASWNRPTVSRKRTKKEETNSPQDQIGTSTGVISDSVKTELPLTNGKGIIITPEIVNKRDIQILKAYIDFLQASAFKEEKTPKTDNHGELAE